MTERKKRSRGAASETARATFVGTPVAIADALAEFNRYRRAEGRYDAPGVTPPFTARHLGRVIDRAAELLRALDGIADRSLRLAARLDAERALVRTDARALSVLSGIVAYFRGMHQVDGLPYRLRGLVRQAAALVDADASPDVASPTPEPRKTTGKRHSNGRKRTI